jgi:hypothetical protein
MNWISVDEEPVLMSFVEDKETDDAVKSMMVRLCEIEVKYEWEYPWSDIIKEWGLSWEVYMSSYLTPSLISNLSDEDFISKVSDGMVEWDI